MRHIYLVLGLAMMVSCSVDNHEEHNLPEPVKDPAWFEQWEMMKLEGDRHIPQDFTLKMRAEAQQRRLARSTGNLRDIEELGPFRVGGRTRAFIQDAQNPRRYLAGGISGGIWESLDRGNSWRPLTDDDQNLSVTGISQNPFNPDIIYYSTGEVRGNSAGVNGVGLFKSTDGGQSFELIPETGVNWFFSTWRVRCSNVDSNTVFVASRFGLLKSINGGVDWEFLFNSECSDVELDQEGRIWAAIRGDGLYRSTDSTGSTFEKMEHIVLPEANEVARIEISLSENNPGVIYAGFENDSQNGLEGIYRSSDFGQTWTPTATPESFNTTILWYAFILSVHPDDPDIVWYGSQQFGYSTDGGQNWLRQPNVHVDIHFAYYTPESSDTIILGHDGGLTKLSLNGPVFILRGSLNNGFNVTQFYTGTHIPVRSVQRRDEALGGTQDNGTQQEQISPNPWNRVFGGDGGYVAFDPRDNTRYVSFQRGNIHRDDNGSWTFLMNDLDADSDGNQDDPTWFIAPYFLDEHDRDIIYYFTRSRVWVSYNRGDNWTPLTAEINQPFSITSTVVNGELRAFIGGANGAFWRIRDVYDHLPGREENLQFSQPDMLGNAFLREMVMDPSDQNVLYAVFSSFSPNPRVWKVHDVLGSGPQWEDISSNLPPFLPVNAIQVSDFDPARIVLGTDYGVYTTIDGGNSWDLELGIPQAPVFQMDITDEEDVFVFTHGRGVFKARFDELVATKRQGPSADIGIFPNPVSDQLDIRGLEGEGEVVMSMFNSAGVQVLRRSFSNIAGTIQLNVSQLQNGVYVLSVRNGSSVINKHVIVNN